MALEFWVFWVLVGVVAVFQVLEMVTHRMRKRVAENNLFTNFVGAVQSCRATLHDSIQAEVISLQNLIIRYYPQTDMIRGLHDTWVSLANVRQALTTLSEDCRALTTTAAETKGEIRVNLSSRFRQQLDEIYKILS